MSCNGRMTLDMFFIRHFFELNRVPMGLDNLTSQPMEVAVDEFPYMLLSYQLLLTTT